MMVVGSPDQAGTALLAGEIPCPHCSTPLRPHGHSRHRTVRGLGQERLTVQRRRARCADCGHTQFLLPAALALRRVRRWLRRVPDTHVHWLKQQAVKHAFRLNPDKLVRPKQWPSLLGWHLNIFAGAALAFNHRASVELPPWTVIGHFTRDNILSPPLHT